MTDYRAAGWLLGFIIEWDGVIDRKVWNPAERDDQAEVAVFRRLLGVYEPSDEG